MAQKSTSKNSVRNLHYGPRTRTSNYGSLLDKRNHDEIWGIQEITKNDNGEKMKKKKKTKKQMSGIALLGYTKSMTYLQSNS